MTARATTPANVWRRFIAVGMLLAGVCVFAAPAARGAVLFGQIDTFEDGLTGGWHKGNFSQLPSSVVNTGGPAGVGDQYLQNVSNGESFNDSKQVVFNDSRWTGNYTTAGITRVSLDLANFGTEPLAMRIGVAGGMFNSRFVSTSAIPLPADGVWRSVTFELTPATLQAADGAAETLAAVLANVNMLRLLHRSSSTVTFAGDVIASTLGVDNVRGLRLRGDADFDGVVGPGDFNLLATNFGKVTGATWGQGDFDFDGTVGPSDFNLLATNFGKSDGGIPTGGLLAAAIAVPEPVALLPAFTAVVLPLLRRRQRPQ